MLTDEDVAMIEKRANAATGGPWAWQNFGTLHLTGQYGLRPIVLGPAGRKEMRVRNTDGIMVDLYPDHPDADFIAHARTDVPRLVADWKEQAATIAELRAEIKNLKR
jgi:hypothetical protein